jgi:PHD/YefM family antitoxin component YafN of YafNO toxin-antitoxin module
MMHIKPSAAIRKNYNEISTLCKATKEPVFLTKNGEGDLVVMDIETFSRRESMLRLREQLILVEEDRLAGKKGYSIEEVDEMMKKTIREAADELRR